MTDPPNALKFTLTLPTEEAARAVAGLLAGRGHRLVAVRIVDHFRFDPASHLYGGPPSRPEFTGWWNVFSVCLDPGRGVAELRRTEAEAVDEITRAHGGVATGPGGGHPETVLRVFTRVGLVHDLTEQEAAARRAALSGSAPAGRPRPPRAPALSGRPPADERAEMLAIAERVATAGDPTTGADAAGSGATGEIGPDDWADPGFLLGLLSDGAMHQGTCYPHTAAAAADFVALAGDDRLGDRYRSWVLLDLYLIATVGRRELAALADTNHALGRPAVEPPEAVAAREAVANALPALTSRWSRASEAERFLLAALAAACPEAGTGLRPAVAELRQACAGTDRAVTLRLMESLAAEERAETAAVLTEICAWHPDLAALRDSPHATAEQRALGILEVLVIEEVNASRVR